MNKKQLSRLMAIAAEAIRNANDEFETVSETEALTLLGMQLKGALTGLVARASGVDADAAKAAIAAATETVDAAAAAKKAAKLDAGDDED